MEQATIHRPHVVLIDLRMPVMDGLTAPEQLRQRHLHAAFIILTIYNDDEMMLRGLQLGVQGYLLKDTDRETQLNTILPAAQGESLFKPEVMQRAIGEGARLPG
jgi:NarL family two-component system response regulator YdfI